MVMRMQWWRIPWPPKKPEARYLAARLGADIDLAQCKRIMSAASRSQPVPVGQGQFPHLDAHGRLWRSRSHDSADSEAARLPAERTELRSSTVSWHRMTNTRKRMDYIHACTPARPCRCIAATVCHKSCAFMSLAGQTPCVTPVPRQSFAIASDGGQYDKTISSMQQRCGRHSLADASNGDGANGYNSRCRGG